MPPALETLSGSPPAVCFPLFATHHLLLVSGGEGSGHSAHPMPPRCCLRLPRWQLRVTTWHNCVCDVTPCLPGQTRNVWLRISQAWILCLRSNYWLNYPTRILCCLLLALWTLGSEGRDANVQEHSPVVKPWNKLAFAVFLCGKFFFFFFELSFRILPRVVFKGLWVLREAGSERSIETCHVGAKFWSMEMCCALGIALVLGYHSNSWLHLEIPFTYRIFLLLIFQKQIIIIIKNHHKQQKNVTILNLLHFGKPIVEKELMYWWR